MKRRQLVLAGLGLPLAPSPTRAQGSTEGRPMTLVAPFAAGGQIDFVARLYAQKLSRLLGRPVVVDNRPGAGGQLAARHVARSAPDGDTLLATSGTFLIAPHAFRNAGYQVFRDFAVVSGLYSSGTTLVINAGSQARTLQDFIATARARPKQLTYATNGVGTYSHLLMSKFMSEAGIELVHVPYKSLPEGSQAVVGGFVDAAVETVFGARTDRLRPLVVFAAEREKLLPGVPSVGELGFRDTAKLGFFAGIVAPAATPHATMERLQRASGEVLKDPDYVGRLESAGMNSLTAPADQVRAMMQSQDKFFADVIAALNLELTQ